ncbi:MAG: RluA family pseudouridine synthase [Eubacteriales bacterium]
MEYLINKEQDGLLLRYFIRNTAKISGGFLKKLKKDKNAITVNGTHQNVTYVLREGDRVKLLTEDTEDDVDGKLIPVDIPLDIIYEDENITVVNKPSDMPTHPSHNHYTDTLANALAFRYRQRPYIFRAVNRLDRDTSGVVLTANNRNYGAILSQMIRDKKIQKEYIAIVSGRLEGEGDIEAPIARVGRSIIEREVRDDGEYALTHYRSLCACDKISVIAAFPETGRTHQLRVHFAYIGHPIVGDEIYGEKSDGIQRQALHALKMSADGIGTFTAPLPSDMRALADRYFTNVENIINAESILNCESFEK